MKNKKSSFKITDIRKGGSSFFDIVISEDMLKGFAELTGDFSSLHVDKEFGRKTMYRKNTAHGMLPVSFISLFDFFRVNSHLFLLQNISANFLKPVFIGQELTLKGTILNFNFEDNNLSCSFTVHDKKSNSILTSGILCGRFKKCAPPSLPPLKNKKSSKKGMLISSLIEKKLEINQIDKNDKASFKFSISKDIRQKLYSILYDGIINGKGSFDPTRLETVQVNHHLANSLFSSFVGMCLPGRYATFTNFSCTFLQNIENNTIYELTGKVAFKSISTESLLLKITIQELRKSKNISLCAEGEINVKVNRPAIKMPSLLKLKKNEVDWGLKDKVILITGGSRGLGETMAKMFSLHGSKVVVNYFQGKNDAKNIIKEIKKNGGEGFAHQADVSQLDQVKKMVKRVCLVHDRIDVLVNNAVGNVTPIDFTELTWDEIQQDIDIILKGAFNCCKEIIPLMIKNGSGKIINMSTIFVDLPFPKQTKYILAKSGLVGLTRSLAYEFASKNIQVNMVQPSITQTDLTAHVSKMSMNAIANESPQQRNASPSDVAKAVIYLASSYSSYTTGQKIMVTGGRPPFL